MVKIRLKMMGRAHRRFFRICAMDSRQQRDGKVIEDLGSYDPRITDGDQKCSLNKERVEYWLSVGAQPTEKTRLLLDRAGVQLPETRKRNRKKKKTA